jgi:hypothetical protein
MATSTRLGSLRLGPPDNAELWVAVEVPIEVDVVDPFAPPHDGRRGRRSAS